MTVSRIPGVAAPVVKRVVKDAEETEADFLALRLLNKKARVRLSPSPVKLDTLPGKGALFASSSETGCFAAATCNTDGQHCIIVSGLAELRSAFTTSESDSEIPFSPRCTISLPAQPNLLCFASNGARLVVSLISGSIAIYDAAVVTTSGPTSLQPLHVFNSPTGRPARELSSNPGDMPDLVAVLYEPGSPESAVLEILDAQKLQTTGGWQSGVMPQTTPTSVCWSPKGKQVAIGLQSGDIITFSPNDISSVKTMIPRPTSHQLPSLVSISWLSNPDFLCIHTPTGLLIPDSQQAHVIISLDSKSSTVTEVPLASPYLPFPGLRPPGSFLVVFRQWEPTKFLIFMGDSTSSDIGLIGCIESDGEELWRNYTLEETSTPTVPLDQEMNDTVLIGLSLDLTATESYTHKTVSGEDSILPPPPVMYAYASDGTIVGWNILNILGKAYPGMKSGVPAPAPIQQIASVNMESAEMDDKPEPMSAQPAAAPQTQPTSELGQSSSTPVFGQGGFGQPAFGQPASSGTPAFGTPSNAGGFGAFASAGPSKFGQPSSLGANSLAVPSSPALASPMAVSNSNASAAEETMSTDTPTEPSFGGLSLGGSGSDETNKSKSTGTTGAFGAFGSPPAASAQNDGSPAFGSTSSFGSVLKPATGFGAFGGQTTSSFGPGGASSSAGAFSSSANAQPSTPSPAFGSSSLGAAQPATPAFGQSAFGQSSFGSKPAFGQSAFGQSSFGTPSTPPKPAFGSSGGFAAFASGGATSFGSAVKISSESKSTEPTPKDENKSTFGSSGGFAAFAQGGTTAFGSVGNASSDSKRAEPATPKDESKPDTPSEEKKVESTTPATSPFATPSTPAGKSTPAFGSPSAFVSPSTPTKTPPSTGGAFGNLTASPIGFGKLDSGFGAFGSATPSSSPFFNPPKNAGPSAFGGGTVPAFAATPSAPSTPTPAAKPTFGAPSTFGKTASSPSTPETKSVFGASSPFGSSPSAFGQSAFANLGSNSASAKGFSNFSGGGGFGAFASGGQKSFSDLLRSDTDGKDKDTPTPKAPVSVFSNPPPLPSGKDEDKGEGSSSAAQPKRTSVFAVPLDKKSDPKDDTETGPPSSDDGEASDDGEGDDHPYDDDDTGSFISETFSDEELPEGHEDEEEDVEALLEAELAAGLANMPPMPTIHLTDSSPPESPDKEASALPEDGTPSSGKQDEQPPVVAPAPVNAASPSAFGFGMGRPSTKPTRSSPLASAPISGRDSEDDTTEKLPQSKGSTPAETGEPKPSGSKSSSPGVKTEGKDGVASRPKTPPTSALFGPSPPIPKPSPFTLAPSAAPTPPVFSIPPASSSPKPGDSGAQATPAKTPSVFSPPATSTTTSKQAEAPSSGEPSRTTTPLFPQGGLFGSKPSTPVTDVPGGKPATPTLNFPPAPSGPLFAQKPATATPGAATPSPASTPGAFPATGLFGQKPATPPASAPGAGSLFGQKPATPPPASGGLFGQKPATPPPASAPGALPPGGLFGQKPATPSPATPSAFPASGLFPPKPATTPSATLPAAAGGPLFGKLPQAPSTTPGANAPRMEAAQRPTDRLDPFAGLDEGMQKESMNLVLALARELEILRREAEQAMQRRAEVYRPKNVPRTAQDLGDPTKFGIADVKEFSALLKTLESDIASVQELRADYLKALRELETAMLKATMRKEEIVRFSKAKSDAEFAKMLKTRTLGPEHLETQTQLRRGIRLLRDRIQKLEEHLEGSKKRISQFKQGKPGLRPPSLDTINRTYRNIDIAVAQQAEEVARLAERLDDLDLKSVQPNRNAIDFRSSPGKRKTDTLPDVAATTAAALNAERAAQKLKSALHRARKEPLLNKQAAAAPPPPSDFVSAQKATQVQDTPTKEFKLSSSMWNAGLPSTPGGPQTPTWGKPLFQSPDSSSSPSPSHGHGPRSRDRESKHAKPIPLKKSPGAAASTTPSTPPGFSWGPLPGVTPMKTLSPDVRKKEEASKLPFSLSSSWVTEGFDTKK